MYTVLVTYFGLCIIYWYVNTCICVCVCVCVHVCHIHTHIRMWTHAYVCVCACVSHTHTHMRAHTYTHTHTQMGSCLEKEEIYVATNISTHQMWNLRHRIWEEMNSTTAILTSHYQLLTSPFHQQHRIWITFLHSYTQQLSFPHTISSSKHCMQIHRQITNCNTNTVMIK